MLIGGIFEVLFLIITTFCLEIGEFLSKNRTLFAQQATLFIGLTGAVISVLFIAMPARSLCSDVVPPKQQVLVSAAVTVYGGLGGLFFNLIGGLGIYKFTRLRQESFILLVGLVIVIISYVVTIVSAIEEPLTIKPEKQNPFKALIYTETHLPKPIFRAGIAYFFSQIATYELGFQLSHFMGKTIEGGDNSIDASAEQIDKYQKGVSWAMMCNLVSYGVQFVYSFVHPKCVKLIGMRVIFIVLMIVQGIILLLFFWVRSKTAFLFMHIGIGLGVVAYNAIPQAIVSFSVSKAELGKYLGALQSFEPLGNQIANWAIGFGMRKVWPEKPGHLIAISSVFSFIAAVAGFYLIIPDLSRHPDMAEPLEADERQNVNPVSASPMTDDYVCTYT